MPSMFVAPGADEKIVQSLKKAGPEFEKKLEDLKKRKKLEAQNREAERLERFELRPSA